MILRPDMTDTKVHGAWSVYVSLNLKKTWLEFICFLTDKGYRFFWKILVLEGFQDQGNLKIMWVSVKILSIPKIKNAVNPIINLPFSTIFTTHLC